MIKLKINGTKVDREATGTDDDIRIDAVMCVYQLGEILAGTMHCSIDEGISELLAMAIHSQEAYVKGRTKKKMSSIRARNRGSFNDIQQFYFERATHMVAICVCTMTVALHEEFGFGNERCARLLERYKKINRHMNDYQDDVKSEAELRGAMAQIGLQEFADQILSMHEIEHYRQEIKNMNKVSVKEAAEAKRQLEMMQEIMKQQQNRKMSLT